MRNVLGTTCLTQHVPPKSGWWLLKGAVKMWDPENLLDLGESHRFVSFFSNMHIRLAHRNIKHASHVCHNTLSMKQYRMKWWMCDYCSYYQSCIVVLVQQIC